MGKRLFVGNLSFDVNESELRDLFAQSGHVADCKLVTDRETGRPRGFGFVEMGTEAEAGTAINNLNGRDYQGRTLNVNEAQERSSGGGGGRGGGGGGGYGGGGGGRSGGGGGYGGGGGGRSGGGGGGRW
ncbi:MAG: RNA-binding protein [Deltaproteobacteria bacterium]|nr:RNA-binding protein [Deltaproteobacteria bacterium]